jgi:AMMECR1 domain-containing protein
MHPRHAAGFTRRPRPSITVRMKPLALACVVLAGWATAAAGKDVPPPQAPALPELTEPQGRALVQWARLAMGRHLTHRTPAGELRITPELAGLRKRTNAVGLTLRGAGGGVLALQVRTGADLCTNLATAALQAMRSSKLPDRVDQKVLDALTLEVEILSDLQDMERPAFDRALVPGLMGLAYCRGQWPSAAAAAGGEGVAWLLPSAAYILGLDADQIRRAAMVQFRLTQENASLAPRLAVFATRHYVGFPDGTVVDLYRGKDLSARAKADAQAISAGAEMIGLFLARHQATSGQYQLPSGNVPVAEHLHATWAMTRLARRSGKVEMTRSAASAVGFACGLAQTGQGRATVAAGTPADTLAATAMLALALAEGQADPKAARLLGELRATLADAMRDRLGAALAAAPPPGGAAGTTQPASAPSAAARSGGVGAELYIALLALGQDKQAPPLREPLAKMTPADARAALWACRAGVGKPPPALSRPADAATPPTSSLASADTARGLRQLPPTDLPDQRGGFAVGTAPPLTRDTALAAVCLADMLKRPAASGGGEARRSLADAQRFCYGMIYQPRESYFAEDPAAWLGAVRACPAASAITVEACAAAIEALLPEGR